MSGRFLEVPADRDPARLRTRVLAFLRRRLAADPPPIRLRFADGESFDLGPDPAVTIAD